MNLFMGETLKMEVKSAYSFKKRLKVAVNYHLLWSEENYCFSFILFALTSNIFNIEPFRFSSSTLFNSIVTS